MNILVEFKILSVCRHNCQSKDLARKVNDGEFPSGAIICAYYEGGPRNENKCQRILLREYYGI